MNQPSIYVASKTIHAARWRDLRDKEHYNIISTWIDEAGEGQSASYEYLADRCIREASNADMTLLYCEPGDILKGALIEVGAALANGKKVRCVGECESISRVFRRHWLWSECSDVGSALYTIHRHFVER